MLCTWLQSVCIVLPAGFSRVMKTTFVKSIDDSVQAYTTPFSERKIAAQGLQFSHRSACAEPPSLGVAKRSNTDRGLVTIE